MRALRRGQCPVSDPTREPFGRLAERVCSENGFQLEPGGARVPLPASRSQLIAMERFDYQGRERVRLWTRIGPEADLGNVRMEAALRVNARLPHGALRGDRGRRPGFSDRLQHQPQYDVVAAGQRHRL